MDTSRRPDGRDCVLQYPVGDAPPSGVHQGHEPALRRREVDRDTVCYGHREQHAGLSRGVAVHAVQHQPAGWHRLVPSLPDSLAQIPVNWLTLSSTRQNRNNCCRLA